MEKEQKQLVLPDERAVVNWEVHWARKPVNQYRYELGLPTITAEEFKQEVILERDEVVAIARAQKEAWK